jgi:hypothetical protein
MVWWGAVCVDEPEKYLDKLYNSTYEPLFRPYRGHHLQVGVLQYPSGC